MQHLHKFMAIDPGVNTGWAYWGAKDTIVPEDTGVFRAPGPKERGLEQRLHFMFKEFTKLMEMYQPNFVVIERTGATRSHASAPCPGLSSCCRGWWVDMRLSPQRSCSSYLGSGRVDSMPRLWSCGSLGHSRRNGLLTVSWRQISSSSSIPKRQ
jgi:hypothetical protein